MVLDDVPPTSVEDGGRSPGHRNRRRRGHTPTDPHTTTGAYMCSYGRETACPDSADRVASHRSRGCGGRRRGGGMELQALQAWPSIADLASSRV
jgi:hypothetical protein